MRWAGSRTSVHPASSGAYSHLWGSSATESARASARRSSEDSAGRLPGRRTRRHVEPEVLLPRDPGQLPQRVSRPTAHRPGGADEKERQEPRLPVFSDTGLEHVGLHPAFVVNRDPVDGFEAEPEQVGRLLQPRVRFDRRVDHELAASGRSPASRMFHEAFAFRAARKPVKLAMFPPLTSNPPQVEGSR